jgi:hypothetical protein
MVVTRQFKVQVTQEPPIHEIGNGGQKTTGKGKNSFCGCGRSGDSASLRRLFAGGWGF